MKHFSKVLLATGALALSAFAHAAPVNFWDVTTTGVWSSFAPNPGVTRSADQKTLIWGESTGSGQSSLVITNPNPASPNIATYWGGGLPTAGYIAPSIALTHNNNPITGTSLTNATLKVSMTLKPTDPPNPAFALPTLDYLIKFVETPNSGTCAAPSPANNPCNDIFVLVGGLLNETFNYGGQDYFVNAFPTIDGALSQLTASACAAAGQPAGCIGFTTKEKNSTFLPFGVTISSERLQVPEPGSLALMGLALAGLAFVNRRRSAV